MRLTYYKQEDRKLCTDCRNEMTPTEKTNDSKTEIMNDRSDLPTGTSVSHCNSGA